MANPLDMLMAFLVDNILVVVVVCVAVYMALMYLKVKSKSKYKVIDRRKIEKANFIEEMKYNVSDKYNWLFKGKQLIGKITHYVEAKEDIAGRSPVTMIKIVFKPTFRRIPFVKPFTKPEALMIEDDSLNDMEQKALDMVIEREEKEISKLDKKSDIYEKRLAVLIKYKKEKYPLIVKNETGKFIRINSERGLDYYFGIYFDMKNPDVHSDNIINTRVLKTDVEQLASRYFTKSQEQCVYSPEMAHQFALKERELAIELAKAKGKRESI